MGDAERDVVERFVDAHIQKDREAGARLLHHDYVLSWPQSGEVIRGAPNWRAIFENYPEDERTALTSGRIVGSEDRWALTPTFTLLRIAGSGDTYTHEGTVRYANGEVWCYVGILEIRVGKIWRETDYFAPPFDAPAWRSPWVEKATDSSGPTT